MRKVFLLFLISFFTCSCQQFFSDSVESKECTKDIQRIYKGEIDEIKISSSIYAEIIKSNDERVVLIGEDKDLANVVVELVDGKLKVYQERNSILTLSTEKMIKVKVYVRDFKVVQASSSATIKIKNKFTQSEVNVVASSSGSIKGNLEANLFAIKVSSSGEYEGRIWAIDLDTEASSSGNVEIKGKAKNAAIKVSSSAEFDGEDLTVDNADLKVSSSGELSIKVMKEVKAKASSSGDIVVYSGEDLKIVNTNESSSGNVKFKK